MSGCLSDTKLVVTLAGPSRLLCTAGVGTRGVKFLNVKLLLQRYEIVVQDNTAVNNTMQDLAMAKYICDTVRETVPWAISLILK